MDRIDPATMIVSDPQVVGCALGDGAALLNLHTNIYYSLNEIGSFVWDELSSPVRFDSLCQRVGAEFAAPMERVDRDLARLVHRMNKAGLLHCFRE